METQMLVESGITVNRITKIVVGNIYKRLDTPSYGTPKVLVGKVLDVLDNGDKVAVSVVEFVPIEYGTGANAVHKTFSGADDIVLYPVTDEEFQVTLKAAITGQRQTIETAERDLAGKQAVLRLMEDAHTSFGTQPAVEPVVREVIQITSSES